MRKKVGDFEIFVCDITRYRADRRWIGVTGFAMSPLTANCRNNADRTSGLARLGAPVTRK